MAQQAKAQKWQLRLASIALSSLGAGLLSGLSLPSLASAQGAEKAGTQTLVSIQVENMRALEAIKGEVAIEVDGAEPQRDSAQLDIPAGGMIAHRSEFMIGGSEFGWSVEISGDTEGRLLFLRGRADIQGQAWYTQLSFPGRDTLALASDSAQGGVVTIKLSVLQAVLQFRSEWRSPEEGEFAVSFSLDGDGDGKFDANETSTVQATLVDSYLQAESNPLVSAKKVADFKISVTDREENKVVDIEGKCDFERNEWLAHAWFDKSRIKSITAKPIFKESELSTTLPSLVSIAAKSEGLEEPGWQQGAEMTFREPDTTLESPATETTREGKESPTLFELLSGNQGEIAQRIVQFIEQYWMVWIIFLLVALAIVSLSLFTAKRS